jgi:hypothetical protein
MEDEMNDERKNNSASEDEMKSSKDRVLQRIADAFKVKGMEEGSLSRSLGLSRPLADFEQRVLKATLALDGNGDVSAVTEKVNEWLTPSASTTAVLFTLNQLDGEGFVSSTVSDAGKFYQVTEEGRKALAAVTALTDANHAMNPQGDFA